MRLSVFLESKGSAAPKAKSYENLESKSGKWTFFSLRSSKSRQSTKRETAIEGKVLEKTKTAGKQATSLRGNKESDDNWPSAALKNENKTPGTRIAAFMGMGAKDNAKPSVAKRAMDFKSHGTDVFKSKPVENMARDKPFRRISISDSAELDPADTSDLTKSSSPECSEADLTPDASPDSCRNLNSFDNFERPMLDIMQLLGGNQVTPRNDLEMTRFDNNDKALDEGEKQQLQKMSRHRSRRPKQPSSQTISQRSPLSKSSPYMKSQREGPYVIGSSEQVGSKVRPTRMASSERHRPGSTEECPSHRSDGGGRTKRPSLAKEVFDMRWTVRSPTEKSGTYTGESLHGMVPHGSGIMHFMNGDIYEGEFVYGEMRGNNVTYKSSCGAVYEGAFFRNMKHGNGEEVFQDGSRYLGRYDNDRPHGFGIKYNPDGSMFHAGAWQKGNPVKVQLDGYKIESKFTFEMSILSSSSSSASSGSDQCNSLADCSLSVQSGRSIYSEESCWNSAALSARNSVRQSNYSFLGQRRLRRDDEDIKIALDFPMGSESGSGTDDSEDGRLSMYASTRGTDDSEDGRLSMYASTRGMD
jgi:hypothetical protein